MQGFVDYFLLLLSQFAGGPGCIENNLMRFGIPAVMWAVLLLVAWSRQRQNERPREKWLVWGFGLALARELFMFVFTSLQILGVLERPAAYFISAPLEQALAMAAIVVIAGAFLRYILDDTPQARRYLQIGLIATLACYLSTFWWWAGYSRANPAVRFGQTWPSWIFHTASALLITWAMVILYNRRGWLRNIMMLALSFFLAADLLMLLNVASGEQYTYILCPLSHSFYIFAIPMLGYIYIRETALEKDQAVDALRESEQHFRDIIENTQAGYFFLDPTGAIQQVNRAWLEMHGYASAEEVMGRSYAITQPDASSHEMQAEMRQLLSGQQIPAGESRRLTKEGVIKYHTYSANPVLRGGQMSGVEGFLIDRSQQVAAEAQVQRRNEQMAVLDAIATTISESLDLEHMLISILQNVVAVTDRDAGCIYLYDELGALQVAAKYGDIEVDSEPADLNAADPISQVGRSGQSLETRIVNAAPRLTWLGACPHSDYQVSGVPIKAGEETLGVLAVFGCGYEKSRQEVRLLTAVAQHVGVAVEKARLAEEASRVELLQELDLMRSELIANVSHDLRTPLGLIRLSSTSLLADDVAYTDEVRRELLGMIHGESLRLERIVDDLLLLAQVEGGKLQLRKRPTPASELIEQAIGGLDQIQRRQQISSEITPPALVIDLDPNRMGQVLRNLIGNAIKYSPDGESIYVEAYTTDDEAIFTVSDQGIGIPAAEVERVFDRFHRVDNPLTRQVRGAGLGLAVCRNLVGAHDGRIWVESSVGEGSTFFVAIPLQTAVQESPLLEEAPVV